MNLKILKKEELIKLKEDIDLELEFINNIKTNIKKSNEKNILSDLNQNDKILCICFNGSKIHSMDYVKISFGKGTNPDYTQFSTTHDTKSIGCSSSFKNDRMTNHCFLSDFLSCMYFFTLKPETWKDDLKIELELLIKSRKKNFDKDMKSIKNKVKDFINNNDEVDLLINKCK